MRPEAPRIPGLNPQSRCREAEFMPEAPKMAIFGRAVGEYR